MGIRLKPSGNLTAIPEIAINKGGHAQVIVSLEAMADIRDDVQDGILAQPEPMTGCSGVTAVLQRRGWCLSPGGI